ncbi:hypothetical protein GW17_00048161 [Ensete ventricosum]|nr:hypothetical protein GW17_00048161 [Ensete ventricosum]
MLLLQNGTREVDAGEPEKLQPSGHGEPAHDPGVPAVVVGDHADVRQRRHVEPAVGAVGEALLGAAALHQRVVAGEVLEGRVQHAGDGADLWRRATSARGRLAHRRCAPGATLQATLATVASLIGSLVATLVTCGCLCKGAVCLYKGFAMGSHPTSGLPVGGHPPPADCLPMSTTRIHTIILHYSISSHAV